MRGAHPFRPLEHSIGVAPSCGAAGGPRLTEPMSPDHEPALLTEEAAASKCGISRPTFRRWIAANCIEPVMAAGAARSKLYRREDIEAFARSR